MRLTNTGLCQRDLALLHSMQVDETLTDDTIQARDRIAGLLVLLYAQPVSRISRLPRDAVAIRSSGCHMRLAGEAVPLPEPLSPLIMSYLDHQPNEARPSPWLFPRPGTRPTHHRQTTPQPPPEPRHRPPRTSRSVRPACR